jgi:hypothetical protein
LRAIQQDCHEGDDSSRGSEAPFRIEEGLKLIAEHLEEAVQAGLALGDVTLAAVKLTDEVYP